MSTSVCMRERVSAIDYKQTPHEKITSSLNSKVVGYF